MPTNQPSKCPLIAELARQLTWSEERGRLYHYRTKDKVEVDAIIETPDGRVIGIEVKSGATVRSEDLIGLRNLEHAAGDRFEAPEEESARRSVALQVLRTPSSEVFNDT